MPELQALTPKKKRTGVLLVETSPVLGGLTSCSFPNPGFIYRGKIRALISLEEVFGVDLHHLFDLFIGDPFLL